MDLKATLVQSSLFWEDISRNLDQFEKKLEVLGEETDLIVLPEMFTTGFSMNAEQLAEKMTGPTLESLMRWAAQSDAMVIGSFIAEVSHKYYNRLVCVRPDGSFESYDKKHLFSLAKEEEVYTSGSDRLIIEWKGWNLCPLVCYDLRFPCWARNHIDDNGKPEYDVLIYVANWPKKRSYAWKQLSIARAIENQSYVIAVNRVGKDGKGFEYAGDSCLIDPMGEVVYTKPDAEDMVTLTLSKSSLNKVRTDLQFLKDGDEFELI